VMSVSRSSSMDEQIMGANAKKYNTMKPCKSSQVSKILPSVEKLTLWTRNADVIDYGLKFGDFPNLSSFTAKPRFFRNASNAKWFAETIEENYIMVQIDGA
jgi:hypothetical protein